MIAAEKRTFDGAETRAARSATGAQLDLDGVVARVRGALTGDAPEPELRAALDGLEEARTALASVSAHHQPGSDSVVDALQALFRDRIGPPFEISDLVSVCEAAKLRCHLKIPPGYEDAKRKRDMGHWAYGDFVLWRQTMDMARQQGRAVLVLQNERKRIGGG